MIWIAKVKFRSFRKVQMYEKVSARPIVFIQSDILVTSNEFIVE